MDEIGPRLRLRECILFISKWAAILTSWIDGTNKWLSRRFKIALGLVVGVEVAGVLAAGFTMIQVDEYAAADFIWITLLVALMLRVLSGGINDLGLGRSIVKILTKIMGIAAMGAVLLVWTYLKKGDKPWSVFVPVIQSEWALWNYMPPPPPLPTPPPAPSADYSSYPPNPHRQAPLLVFKRHDLSTDEQERFKAPLLSQSEPREIISIDCPGDDEPDCVYAAKFIELFKAAGWIVADGVVHRITLGVPYSGVVLGVHSDYAFDPNQKVGTGHWVKLTPSNISVQQAFANIGVGVQLQSSNQITEGTIQLYFGPVQTEEIAKENLRQTVHFLEQIKNGSKSMSHMR